MDHLFKYKLKLAKMRKYICGTMFINATRKMLIKIEIAFFTQDSGKNKKSHANGNVGEMYLPILLI